MNIVNPKLFGKVAVLMGGFSAEREVSLMSGQAVLQALLRQGIDAFAIDVTPNIIEQLRAQPIDRVFNILHGPFGEDGTLQGILDTLKIPYTGSGVMASALAMDKIRTKLIWRGLGIPVPDYMPINKETLVEEVIAKFGFPFAVKPVHEGSTFGITKVTQAEQFDFAKKHAFSFDSKVIVEPWIQGKELTVSILDKKALPIIHIESPTGLYDYEAKYFSDETLYHCPSGLDTHLEKKIQALSLDAFESLGCKDWGRVDLILDDHQNIWFLEINTIPGMTDHSLVPKAAKQLGISFDELVVRILSMTLMDIG